MGMPKEYKKVRPTVTTEWVPQVLDDWMLENGVSKEWMALTIGKCRSYLYTCTQKGRIGHDALKKIVELTNIDKDLLTGKVEREVTDWKKPRGVDESKVGYWEFRGIKTDAEGNPIFEEEKEEPVTNAPEPKKTMPDGWLTLMGIETTYYIRKDEVLQIRRLLNGTQVLTAHGTFSVIEDANTILERMATA